MSSMNNSSAFLTGVCLILLVCVFWGGASVLVQYIYCDLHFPHAIFVTFIGSTLIALYLPGQLLLERMRSRKSKSFIRIPWSSGPRPPPGGLYHEVTRLLDDPENRNIIDDSGTYCKEVVETVKKISPQLQNFRRRDLPLSTATPIYKKSPSQSSNHGGSLGGTAPSNSGKGGIIIMEPSADGEMHSARCDEIEDDCNAKQDTAFIYGHLETMRAAAMMCPILLVATLGHDLSLAWTSVTSMMVLSATSTIFAFTFSVLAKEETFTAVKAVGVALCVLGSVITAVHDASDSHRVCSVSPSVGSQGPEDLMTSDEAAAAALQWRLLGDFAGLLSAAGYGAYTTAVRLKCPEDGSMSMELLFGYIGLFNTIALAPLIIWGWSSGSLDLSGLSWTVMGFIIVAGFFNDVLSEYLWAKSIVLTSATISNVGLSLTVPIAFLSDWFMGKSFPTIHSTLGASGIVLGFILVTLHSSEEVNKDNTINGYLQTKDIIEETKPLTRWWERKIVSIAKKHFRSESRGEVKSVLEMQSSRTFLV